MTAKETYNPMLTTTTTVEAEKKATVTASRAVEVAINGLRGHRYLNLTTFRKSGIAVVTTIWFAVGKDKIYVWTAKDSGKVKRIRNNPAVRFAPSTRLGRPRGPMASATTRILSSAEQAEAQHMLDRRFGLLKRLFALIWRLQGREQVYIEITPTEE